MSKSQESVRFIVLGIAILAISTLAVVSNPTSFLGLFAPNEAAAASKVQADVQPRAVSVNTCTGGNTVEVEATAGTLGPTNYTTLGAAFAAINAGTHQGSVTVKICANTNEGTSPATLNSSGAGGAVYTSVNIFPANDGVSITGNPVQGFGVIQLNGADNVTINGDNPNTAGTNRNLTVANTAAANVTFNSAIRISNSAAVTSSDNDTIKNLILNGNVTGGNASSLTSGSTTSSFGIYVGGNGGVTVADAPIAITSTGLVTTNAAPSGTTINNLSIDNNAINQCSRAIVFNGVATSVSSGVTISNNTIGASGAPSPATPPFTSPATTVYTKGIIVAGTNAVSITGNTIQNIISYANSNLSAVETVSPIGTSINISSNTITNVVDNANGSTSQFGIALGVLGSTGTGTFTIAGNNISGIQGLGVNATTGISTSYNGTSGLIEKNKVTGVFARNPGTFGANGLVLLAGNNVTVQNNFVSDIKNDETAGTGADPGSLFDVYGIKVASGTGHKIYHNSINLFGTILFGTTGTSVDTDFTTAFAILSTSSTGLDVRNNVFSNLLTGGNTAGNNCRHAAIYLPSGGTSSMNLTLNNNDYYSSGSPISILGQAGTTIGTNEYLAANFNPAATTPASNMRSYTSTLSAAGTNDNASKKVDPVFVSNTDLHIQSSSTMEGMGANVGVTTDIDGNARGATPDIGADEISLSGPGTVEFSAVSYTGNEGTAPVITVHRVGGNSGAISVAYSTGGGTAMGGASCTAGIDYINTSGTLNWAAGDATDKTFSVTLCADAVVDNESVQLTLSNPAGTTITGTNPVNLNITDVQPPLGGSYNVGAGGDFTSLTNAGGIFDRLNTTGATSNITINITTDLAGESGAVSLNEIAGGFAVLIKPSGAPRSITGSNAGALIKINGADGVKIDGSTAATFEPEVAGGNPALRQLTIQNTDPGASATVISVQTGTNGAHNNTIQNVNVLGQDPLTTLYGISLGGDTPGTNGADNDNNHVQNCSIRRAVFGIYSAGSDIANPNTGTVIAQNDLTGTTVDRIQRVGILLFNDNGAQVTENAVGGLDSAADADAVGIGLGVGSADDQFNSTAAFSGGINNALVERNRINGVRQTNTWGAAGIAVAGDSSGANTIRNNMISGVIGAATAPDIVAGIFVAGAPGSATRLYYNSVSMTGDRSALPIGQYPSYGVAITGIDPTVELKDNIFYTTQTGDLEHNPNAQSFGIGMETTTFVNLNSNYNDFWSTGANDGGFRSGSLADLGGTNYADLAAWHAATGDDIAGNSQEMDPLFVSTSDLHLQAASPVLNDGTPIAGVATDFDGEARNATTPDVGADEVGAAGPSTVTVSGKVLTPDNRGLRNAVVKLLDQPGGNVVASATTSTFGVFTFPNVPTGQTYTIKVLSKLYRFNSRSQTVGFENLVVADFVGME